MMRRSAIILTAIFLLAGQARAGDIAPANLLANPGFEEVEHLAKAFLIRSGGPRDFEFVGGIFPKAWQVLPFPSAGGRFEVVESPGEVRSGRRALKITAVRGHGTHTFIHWVEVVGGVPYTFRVWARGRGRLRNRRSSIP